MYIYFSGWPDCIQQAHRFIWPLCDNLYFSTMIISSLRPEMLKFVHLMLEEHFTMAALPDQPIMLLFCFCYMQKVLHQTAVIVSE